MYSYNRDSLEPGMQAVVLDSEGRLLEFHAHPPTETRAGDSARVFEWSRLFATAGLDFARFKATPSEITPTAVFDVRAAWTGSAEGTQDLRVEAAAFQGRPVSFRVLGPWARPSQPPAFSFGIVSAPMYIVAVFAVPAGGALLAWRNVRSGRGDRRGAFRLAGFLFLFTLLDNLAYMHHVPTPAELALLFAAMKYAVTLGALGWLLYMAFEPQVRRRSPESLISWNRLLAGRFWDPMVGGHLLLGVSLGVVSRCVVIFLAAIPFLESFAPQLPWSNLILLSLWFWLPMLVILGGLAGALILNWISIPVQRKWLAAAVFVLVMTLALMPSYGPP